MSIEAMVHMGLEVLIVLNVNPLAPNDVYTGCPRGNVPDFRRMFPTLKYTDITQNTYVYPKLNGYGDNGERSLKV